MENEIMIAEEKAFKKLFRRDKTEWTKEKLMACLKKFLNKDVFTMISDVCVHEFTDSEPFGNDVVKEYLQYLLTNPDFRLQTYSIEFGTVFGLIDDLIKLQNIPLFYKYVNLPRSEYYYSRAFLISDQNVKRDFYSKIDVVLFIYQHIEPFSGAKKAEKLFSKAFERLEGCYELVPAITVDDILGQLDMVVGKSCFNKVLLEQLDKLCLLEAPTVRMNRDMVGDWFFAKEVEIAVKIAFEKRYPFRTLPDDWNQRAKNDQNHGGSSEFILLDNEEDRALGVLHMVGLEALEELLKSLELKMEDLNIINLVDEETWYHAVHLPVISPYGSHCRFAIHAFSELINSLTMDLRLFQRIKRSSLPKVTKWLSDQKVLFDEKRTYPFLIESWKIEEIKEKAHNELKRLCTGPVYNIPVKPSFTKLEVIHLTSKFSPVLNIKDNVFIHLNCTSSHSKHSYYNVHKAFVWGTISKHQRSDKFQSFTIYQTGKAKMPTKDYIQNIAPTIVKSILELDLPPGVKFGKNDLGEVQAPKNKKNIKPDFTKKMDEEAVIVKALKCFNQDFEKFQCFKLKELKEYFDGEELEYLEDVLEGEEKNKEIEKVFAICVIDGCCFIKRKSSEQLTDMILKNNETEKTLSGKVDKLENEQKLKNMEIERLNKKLADTVQQSIEKIRKTKDESGKKIQELEEKLEVAMKNLEESKKTSKIQISNVKQGYRGDLTKLKEDLAAKEAKNQKLAEELKESYEKLRNEREKKYTQADEDLKNAMKNMEKMKKENEDLKLWKTKKSKEIAKLEKEISSLKTQLEIAERKISENVEEHEEEMDKENVVDTLLARNEQLNAELQKMTEKCEELERRQL